MPPSYDPFDRSARADPYPAYRELRDRAPVHRAPQSGIWCVSRYDDVQTVLKTPEVFSSRAMFTMLMNNGEEGTPPLTWPVIRGLLKIFLRTRMNPFEFATARNLIAEDGDRHAAMRTIVNRGFTPRRIAAWERRARELAGAAIEDLRAGKPYDLVQDFAIPLPVTLIAEMLGVEPERRGDFKRWSDAVVRNASGPGRDSPFNSEFIDNMCEVTNYVGGIARERRRAPADDLISIIVAHQEGDVALTDREVVQFVVLLLVAGNETTTNLIGNAVTALLDHPDQLQRAVDDPTLVPEVVEETLRYDAPIQLVFRTTTRDFEIGGVTIPAGEFVAPLLGSANRDERQFPDPDRFDIGRDTRGHVGFGFGTHFCLGSSLARLEARVALETLLPELPNLERAGDTRELVDSFLVRGPLQLELRPAA